MGNLSIKTFFAVTITGAIFSVEKPKEAVISADALNILYIGIDNLISIAVSEVADKDVVVDISVGTITKTDEPGKYICRIGKVEEKRANITVSVKKAGRIIQTVKSKEYRLQEIHYPELLYGSLSSGRRNIHAVLGQSTLNAGLGRGFAID